MNMRRFSIPDIRRGPRQLMFLAPVMLAVILMATPGLQAAEVAGIQVPDTARIDDQTLLLNGAGLRSRFFVRVYVGALYLANTTGDPLQAISMPGPKRVALHMIYDELSAGKVTSAWMDGFRSNHADDQLESLMPRIEAFNALWPALSVGDRVQLDYVPGHGTRVVINGVELGRIQGGDFNQAMLRIWLGESPADSDLKRGMLGQ